MSDTNRTGKNKRCNYSQNIRIFNPNDEQEFHDIIDIDEMASHMHVIGATKSGKTELLKLIYVRLNLQVEKSSIVLFDPHGDLAVQCAKLMDDKKDIIYIDPTLQYGISPTINPFRLKNKDEESISIVAQELLSTFESILGTDFSLNISPFQY